MKNKFKLFALFAAILALTLTACGEPKPEPDPVPVTGITLDESSITLTINGTKKLTATIAPNNATNKVVRWTSDDITKATVADDGTVTAKAKGQATITVTTADGNKTAACTVTVSDGSSTENKTPVSGDYTIDKLNQTAGSVTAVTITPISGKSTGAVSNIKYAGNTTIPQTAGTYAVTFDVAAVTGWNEAIGLSAGILTVTAGTPAPTTYTVIYNANGGTGTMANSTHTIGTAQALTANGFTKDGYLFVCWTANVGGTGTRYYNGQSVTDLTTTATTVNLYAQWAEGNMYYGVTSTAALNALKGTGGSLNVFNTALANPTDNSNVHITTISTSTVKTVEFSGLNYWFILVPKR